MSEQKLISPMLDRFLLGEPISNHDGICCCPAMNKDTEERYIVKIISIPASQDRLEAFLLTGIYPDKESALSYFKSLADEIVEQVSLLGKLSQQEGFIAYDDCQVVPMDDGEVGYDIYLLSPYMRSLKKIQQRETLTHLSGFNLGLDICVALDVCRQAGYIYTDLKPANIYRTESGTFKIGDLGFVSSDSLSYAYLDKRFVSDYSAPELLDEFTCLNATADIYSLGVILYEIFNGGKLPENIDLSQPPMYADYELSEIILKACAVNPDDRWQTPGEMGQALASYMKRNGVNNDPIIPVATNIPVAEPEIVSDEVAQQEQMEADTPAADDISEYTEETVEQIEIPLVESVTEEETPVEEADVSKDDQEPVLPEISTDETAPENTVTEVDYAEVSDELSQILSHADDLMAAPVPEGVVAPEPVEVSVPVAEQEEGTPEAEADLESETADAPDEAESECCEEASEENERAPLEESEEDDSSEEYTEEEATEVSSEEEDENTLDEDEIPEEELEEEEEYEKPRRKGRWIRTLILILLALALIAAGFFFYREYYLQPIRGIRLEGTESSLTVYVDSDIDETLLTVLCTDSYGHGIVAPVTDGKAVFSELTANTGYTVNVQISGFHKLTGECFSAYSTPVQTSIVQLTAVTGSTDGSVILSFRPDGPDSDEWTVTYWTDSEQERSVSFPGHTVTLSDLSIGKEYSFRISPVADLYVSSEDTIVFTPSKRVFAQNLAVGDFSEGKMIVSWTNPEGVTGINWIVQCNDGAEVSQTLTTDTNSATFEGLDMNGEYTVEVRAENMRDGNRIFVNKDSAIISDLTANTETPGQITLSWTAAKTPSEGWVIDYTVDGIAADSSIDTSKNSITISPVVPGARYEFTLRGGRDSSVIGKSLTCVAAEAPDFSVTYTDEGTEFTTTASDITFEMCVRPDNADWDANSISSSDYTNSFTLGQKAGFVMNLSKSYGVSSEDYDILFVVRDKDGKLVTFSSVSTIWRMMWYRRVGNLSIPKLPDTPGEFHMDIYFNGALAGSQDFTIVS